MIWQKGCGSDEETTMAFRAYIVIVIAVLVLAPAAVSSGVFSWLI
jgi:hypothetical protein